MWRWFKGEQTSSAGLSVAFSRGALGKADQVEQLLGASIALSGSANSGSLPAQAASRAAQIAATHQLLLIPVESQKELLQRHLATVPHAAESPSPPHPEHTTDADWTPERAFQSASFLHSTLDELILKRRGFWPRGVIRLLTVAAGLTLLCLAGWFVHGKFSGPRDLLSGAKISPSSRYLTWPAHLMDFHTDIQDHPSAVYDMGTSQQVSRFTIENTRDYPERAAPMALELSQDGREFHQVALIRDPFKVWQPQIPPQQARFVRVISLQRTYFHLKRVEAYR